MLSVSSWSISPPSNRSPGLSGAIRGWSSRMIGEDEHGVVAGSPTSTGQTPSFPHAGAASRRRSGGSVSETNAPPRRAAPCGSSRTCARSASSRVAPPHGVVFAISTVTRAARAAGSTDARPSPAQRLPGPHDRAPPPSCSSSPATSIAIGDRRPRPDLALDRLLPRQWRSPPRQLVDRRRRPGAPGAGRRAGSAPHVDARSPPSTRHSVRMRRGRPDAPRCGRAGRRRRTSSAAGSSAPSARYGHSR